MKKSKILGVSIVGFCLTGSLAAQDQEAAAGESAENAESAEAAEEEPASDPRAELEAAAAKLGDAGNFSWSTTISSGPWGPRVTTGKKGAGGFILTSMPRRQDEVQLLMRGDKAAMEGDDGWALVTAAQDGDRRGGFLARMVENFRDPVADAKELVGKVEDLSATDGGFTGKVGEEAASGLMSFRGRGRRGGDGPPPITGAGGTVNFTVEGGVLTKYEMSLTGRMSFNGEARDLSNNTSVEFKDVGTTSFDIPEAAAGLLLD